MIPDLDAVESTSDARTESGPITAGKRTALLILGMHRSGTSALTRTTGLLGCKLPKDLMPAAANNNETGFWESIEVSRLNDDVLTSAGSAWDDWRPLDHHWARSVAFSELKTRACGVLEESFGDAPLLVLKDPRICRIVPFWLDVLLRCRIDPLCVHLIRNPIEVAESLRRRDGFTSAKSYMLWLRHVLDAEITTRGLRRSFISYEGLLSDWRLTVEKLHNDLALDWPNSTSTAGADIADFLTNRLRHNISSAEALRSNSEIPTWVKLAFDALCKLVSDGKSSAALSELDQVRMEFNRASLALGPILNPDGAVVASDQLQATDVDASLSDCDNRVRDLSALADQRAAQLGHAEAALAERSGRILDLESAVSRYESALTNFDGRIRDLESRTANVMASIQKFEPFFEDRDARLSALELKTPELARALAERDTSIVKLQATYEAERKDLQRQISAFEMQISEIGGLSDSQRSRIESLTRRLEQTHKSASTLEHQRDIFCAKLNSFQNKATWPAARFLFLAEQYLPRTSRALFAAPKAFWWTVTFELPAMLRRRIDAKLLDESGLFDEAWYIHRYPEVVLSGWRPMAHWLAVGWREEKNPHPLFDVHWYLDQNSDVCPPRPNPLIHYLLDGAAQGRDPHPLFSTKWYLRQLTQEEQGNWNPLVHYLRYGWREGKDPHPVFVTSWYVERYPESAIDGIDPLTHFLVKGASQGCQPSPFFDVEWYLSENPDVADATINPLIHYLQFGAWENRDPSPTFSSYRYLEANPEISGRRMNPLVHARLQGRLESPSLKSQENTGSLQAPDRARSIRFDSVTKELSALAHAYDAYLAASSRWPAGELYVADDENDYSDVAGSVRAIAFYLPQFHPIPENDEWWGKGFTEWTNVSKAIPQFEGHYQPHLPGELGFYDLRLPQVQRRQVELARKYGLSGFCYHYYWFAGRRLLEQPLEQMLKDPGIDFPFCICWANENWTRRWDGSEHEILMAQEHTPETDYAMIEDLAPIFRDPRYIHIRGRPILVVYRASLLPEPAQTARRWRLRCRELGLPEPYLVAAQSFGITDPTPFGFDAAVEFPPHNVQAHDITGQVTVLNPEYRGRVFSYPGLVSGITSTSELRERAPYRRYRCVMPGWDNEPRKPGQGHVFAGASPRLYREWLDHVCREAAEIEEEDERLVFINAWNEWGEGAHLEPDRRHGFGYLKVTGDTLRTQNRRMDNATDSDVLWVTPLPTHRRSNIAVVVHVYYVDGWADIAKRLDTALRDGFDLFATVCSPEHAKLIAGSLPVNVNHCAIGVVENRGRDIAPFVAVLPALLALGYRTACKLHTKGKSTRQDGDLWRDDLLRKLLGSVEQTSAVLHAFDSEESLALICPTGHFLPIEHFWGEFGKAEHNQQHFARLAERIGLPKRREGFRFPGGSFYWFRPRALMSLDGLGLRASDFDEEKGQTDGTLAHAIERLVGLLASTDGWLSSVTGEINTTEPPTDWLRSGYYPFACATRDGEPCGDSVAIR